jgi:DNA repair protein SbcC/Rad50
LITIAFGRSNVPAGYRCGQTSPMLTERLFRSTLLHADPARRVIAVAKLPPQSDELAVLLATDPAPEVRIAAANCCDNLSVLAAAWENESDAAVRAALSAALRTLLSESPDSAGATALLGAAQCTDAMRADVARRAPDVERRRSAIAAIREEALLVELALTAEDAKTRMAAAQHVRTPDGLRMLADAARDKDRGVARLARKRLDAIENREGDTAEADVIVSQLEALASKPGPILTTVIELNRRWQALNLRDDPARLARCEAARQVLQARFDREHAEQRTRMQFEHRLSERLDRADPPATSGELDLLRSEVAALREEGENYADTSSRLDEAEQRIERWAQELQARAGAEALVVEAEQLAEGTSLDDAKLPERWQALDQSIRAPALTRRFEAALSVIEQRRLAQIRAAEQQTHSSRQQLHALLHSAEQALAAGQLQTARAAAEQIRMRGPGAGLQPKPTLQRLSRLMQQLKELEAWESFGQHQARVQLCERAESAATLKLDAPHLAAEVQKLRHEWSALDQQRGGVPKTLWERFDRACEKAYAPAARYFAEQAALQKQVRKQREKFIAAAAAQAPTLLVEPRDWRAIERWLRETDRRWRDGELGSMDPRGWKHFDARLRTVLAPLRDALSAARDQAKARRLALIEEATALAAKALERDAPAQVKVIQTQWQAQARELILAQRDERALWEQFRAACDAVFQAREAKRQQEDVLKCEARSALENICVQLEQLALATDKKEQDLRRGLRDLQEHWMRGARTSDSGSRGLESRFTSAKMAMEAALSARARARETEVWRTLAAKERLCDELDRRVCSGEGTADAAAALAQWTALTALPATWEKAMVGRRDAAVRALADESVAAAHVMRIERGSESRREMLLGLELLFGLESPPELQAQRRALQLKQLRERFQGPATTGANSAGDRLLLWCAEPGVADARDRQRCERVFSAMEHAR